MDDEPMYKGQVLGVGILSFLRQIKCSSMELVIDFFFFLCDDSHGHLMIAVTTVAWLRFTKGE